MNQYTSCFIGAPLPKKYQAEFEKLLVGVGKLYPDWKITYPKTPHVTVYYLDKQSQFVLPDIANIVQKEIRILKNIVLAVNGFDYFTKEDAREGIVFLNIVYQPAFVNLNRALNDKLRKYYSADNNLPFHPHMTIARINEIKNMSSIKNCVLELGNKIGKVYWEFRITEIVIYGVDSKIQPQHQKQLITISV